MQQYCSLLSKSFIYNVFLFNVWDYYFESNLTLAWHMKVLLIKKNVTLFCGLVNMKKQLSLMSLFLCLPRISLGQSFQQNCCQRWGSWKYYKERWPHRGVKISEYHIFLIGWYQRQFWSIIAENSLIKTVTKVNHKQHFRQSWHFQIDLHLKKTEFSLCIKFMLESAVIEI